MKLHRIRLRNYRGIRDAEVSFAISGVTIVCGPNEVGKSSVVEALHLLREFKDSSQASAVRVVQPTHHDAGPFVEVEMTVGPYRFTYNKTWLKGRGTQLHITEPVPEQRTGEEAHNRVEQVFTEHLDDDLWAALRQLQGESLLQPNLANIGPLRTALSEYDDGAEHDDLLALVTAERAKYYTEKGRARQPLTEAQRALQTAKETLTEADTKLAEISELAERHEQQRQAHQHLTDRFHTAQERRDVLQQRAEALKELRQAFAQAEARLEQAQLRQERAEDRLQQREQLAERHRERAAQAHAQQEMQKQAEGAQREALEELKQAETAKNVAERAVRDAQAQQLRSDLQSVRDRIADVERLAPMLDVIRQSLRANLVDEKALAALTKAQHRVETITAQLRASAAHVVVEPLGDSPVAVNGDHIVERLQTHISQAMAIEVPNAVRVTIRPDASSNEQAGDIQAAQCALQEMLADYEVPSVAVAMQQREARSQLEVQEREVAQQINAAFGGGRIDDLRAEVQRMNAELAEMAPEVGGEFEVGDSTDIARALRESAAQLATSEAQYREAVQRHRAALQQVEIAKQRAQNAADELDSATTRLEDARKELTDIAVKSAMQEASQEVRDAQLVVQEARKALNHAGAAEVTAGLDEAIDMAKMLGEEVQEARLAVNRTEAFLESLNADGWFDKRQHAQSAVAAAERAAKSVQQRADAARLLEDVLLHHQRAAQERYVRPFKNAITELGQLVYGPDFEVEVDTELRIARRTHSGVTVDFDQLSGGAREQLAMIGRLATARLVDPADGAPVIFDDALGFSDEGRRSGMGQALATAAKDSQVIILTCEPSRYAAVEAARVVELSTSH